MAQQAWPVAADAPLADIGINLTNGKFRRDLAAVLRRSGEANVRTLVVTGTSVAVSRRAAALVRDRADEARAAGVELYATAGVHPHDASTLDDAGMAELERMAALPGVVAVGETGLDFNRMHSPRDVQIESFRRQVALAVRLRKPLFVHEREAHGALLEVLRPHAESGDLPPTVVHCFTGTEAEAREYVRLGLYIGLTTFVAKRNRGAEVRAALEAGAVPLERIMLETDGPYMLPDVPAGSELRRHPVFARRRNEPCTLPICASTVAACLGVPAEEVARVTTATARSFFRL